MGFRYPGITFRKQNGTFVKALVAFFQPDSLGIWEAGQQSGRISSAATQWHFLHSEREASVIEESMHALSVLWLGNQIGSNWTQWMPPALIPFKGHPLTMLFSIEDRNFRTLLLHIKFSYAKYKLEPNM